MQKTLHSLGFVLETSHWYRFHPFYLSISPAWGINASENSVVIGQLHISKACWELWLSDDQPHSDYKGQWRRALCILVVMQSSQPNPQRNNKYRKMYAIKQIKFCTEYRDMLPRPQLDLSGTPWLRLISLSPGSWQASLGLGSMSRYSAHILMWNPVLYVSSKLNGIIFLRLISWLVAGCCLISGMWDNHWITLDELMDSFIPSSGTGFSGCNRKMIASTASSVPHLRSILSWNNPRRGRRVVLVTNLPLKATLWNLTALCADVLLGSL